MTRPELIEWAKAHSTGEMVSPVAQAVLVLNEKCKSLERKNEQLNRELKNLRRDQVEPEVGGEG